MTCVWVTGLVDLLTITTIVNLTKEDSYKVGHAKSILRSLNRSDMPEAFQVACEKAHVMAGLVEIGKQINIGIFNDYISWLIEELIFLDREYFKKQYDKQLKDDE